MSGDHEINRGLFVWRDFTHYSSMEDQLLETYKRFVDGQENHDFDHGIPWDTNTCVRCGVGAYTPLSNDSLLTERFRRYRTRPEADLWASHGNVTIDSQKGGVCPFCGYMYYVEHSTSGHMRQTDWFDLFVTVLRKFDINGARDAIAEIAARGKEPFVDAVELDPSKYEGLVDDAFKNLGYRGVRTQKTCDGGYDLRLYSDGDKDPILVTCKHNPGTVGVKVVCELTAARCHLGLNKGIIVATSDRSKTAKRERGGMKVSPPELEMRLDELQALLDVLTVYNDEIPRLDALAQMGEPGAKKLLEEYAQGRI